MSFMGSSLNDAKSGANIGGSVSSPELLSVVNEK